MQKIFKWPLLYCKKLPYVKILSNSQTLSEQRVHKKESCFHETFYKGHYKVVEVRFWKMRK